MGLTASALRGSRSITMALALIGTALATNAGSSGPDAIPRIACVDPKAALMLGDPATIGRHSARWRFKVARRGRCFSIEAHSSWEAISRIHGLVLMRRSPPQPGLPPLYFRAAPIRAASLAAGAPMRPAMRRAIRGEVIEEALLPPPVPPPPVPPPTAPAIPAATTPPPAATPIAPALPTMPPPIASAPAASERGYALGFVIAVLLIIVLLATVALLLRLLLRRSREPVRPLVPVPALARIMPAVPAARLQTAELMPEPAWPEADAQRRCADLLREAGWYASVRECHGLPGADVVARRGGRVLALRCLPGAATVDEEAIEQTCIARERERADLAAIVSEAPFTAEARKLASQTGIDLLRPDQLGVLTRPSGI